MNLNLIRCSQLRKLSLELNSNSQIRMQICTLLGVNGGLAVRQVKLSQNKLVLGHVWTTKLLVGQNVKIIEINLTKKG